MPAALSRFSEGAETDPAVSEALPARDCAGNSYVTQSLVLRSMDRGPEP